MTDLARIEQEITTYVRPTTFPLAIRLLRDVNEIPAKAKRPSRDLGLRVAICQTLGMSRRYGWTLALTKEDISCPLTFVPFGLADPVPYYEAGNACAGIYTADQAAGQRMEAVTPKLPRGRYVGVVVGPLARASFEPDVICVYGNSAQVMRLVQGSLWATGGAVHSLSAGRIDCAEIIVRTFQTGEPQYILPCTGDRMFGLTADDEMVFAMPLAMADDVVAGLKATHQGGIRYPVPTFMRFQPIFPEQYAKLAAAFAEQEEAGQAFAPTIAAPSD